jgi:uncharacterized protein with PQ loop repeat
MAITDILGALGNAFSIIFFIIPITMMIDVYKTKSTEKVPYLLFLFTILNCGLWTIYGIKINAWPLIACNTLGIITNHIFLTIFIAYLNLSLVKRVLLTICLYITSIVMFTCFYIFIEDPKFFGSVAMVMNICMFVSPLQNLHRVIQLKDNSYIPIWISITLIFNCLCWVLYGYFKDIDAFVIVPNAIGLVLAFIQVILWFIFKKSDDEYNELKQNE